ncbi:C40 family peptidase [Paenibacillus athensensis]|uniref:Hydrolase n=2 Tax=Paenibacillus athensensis TaxID=1967502 RepID=A0A4Y8Q1A1_9BACL|nr:C40 family peptidase [Paenibacillus athensensis]
MKKNRLGRMFLGMTLSVSLIAASSLTLGASSAHAAAAPQAAATSTSSKASSIIATGERYMGVRYQYGSQAYNTRSFDCSSFTQYIFAKNGISLPRSSQQQSKVGHYVSRSQLQPGDLVFFYSPIHHVAVYIGNGKILHTYGSPGVTISSLNSGWWSTHYATARRVL